MVLVVKNPPVVQENRCGFDPWIKKIPWRRKWQPSPLFFPGGSDGKESTCNAEIQVQSLDQEDPLEKGMATHSSILAWDIPWTEKPGRLQSMGLKIVGHDLETK